jgi:hypothetical protein
MGTAGCRPNLPTVIATAHAHVTLMWSIRGLAQPTTPPTSYSSFLATTARPGRKRGNEFSDKGRLRIRKSCITRVQSMIRSRAELDEALYQLHASLPLWRKELATEAELVATYRQLFGRIIESAADCDLDYTIAQLNNLAASTELLGSDQNNQPPAMN